MATETPTSAAISWPAWRCLRKASTLFAAAGPVRLGDEWGREERSTQNPPAPRPESGLTHLATVFGVVLNWRATAVFDRPPSTTPRAIASRPLGVSEAFLCVSIRFSANH